MKKLLILLAALGGILLFSGCESKGWKTVDGVIVFDTPARDRWNDSKITNLKDVAKAVGNKEFAAQLDGLAASLYAPEGGEFKTEAFLKAFEKVRKAKVKSRAGDAQPLPKLYK